MEEAQRSRSYGEATDKQVSRVESKQSTLDANISALHETVTMLEMRLRPVLAPQAAVPSAPPKGNSIRPISPSISPSISERLSESSDIVCAAINRITEIAARLEI